MREAAILYEDFGLSPPSPLASIPSGSGPGCGGHGRGGGGAWGASTITMQLVRLRATDRTPPPSPATLRLDVAGAGAGAALRQAGRSGSLPESCALRRQRGGRGARRPGSGFAKTPPSSACRKSWPWFRCPSIRRPAIRRPAGAGPCPRRANAWPDCGGKNTPRSETCLQRSGAAGRVRPGRFALRGSPRRGRNSGWAGPARGRESPPPWICPLSAWWNAP